MGYRFFELTLRLQVIMPLFVPGNAIVNDNVRVHTVVLWLLGLLSLTAAGKAEAGSVWSQEAGLHS